MLRRLTALLTVILLAAGCTGTAGAAGAARSGTGLASIGAGLRGPSGTEATVEVTGLTDVAALAFDTEGRLWASTAKYEDDGTDGVFLVTAAGSDPVEVIGGLHTPLGLLWYQGSLYVASKDRVDAYSGFDGTRFTSTRTVISLPAGTGESNNLVLAPDGRMLLGISAPCDACTPTSVLSGAIVSFAPDGTDLRVYASKIRAPVGLAYAPGGTKLYVTMNQRDHLGSKTPGDWLSVVSEGESWGFPKCYGQGGAACTGVPDPVATLDKHAAASGVAIVTGQLGTTVGTSAVVAEWTKGAVKRVALNRKGSGVTGAAVPFLTGFKNPEAVAVGPTGALFVGDWSTGKVYRITGTA